MFLKKEIILLNSYQVYGKSLINTKPQLLFMINASINIELWRFFFFFKSTWLLLDFALWDTESVTNIKTQDGTLK